MTADYKIPSLFFVFDVESVGLHGEGFAVAGGVYQTTGVALWEFRMSCPIDECTGGDEGRQWVKNNVPVLEQTHRRPLAMRDSFWCQWLNAKKDGAVMAAECAWPVETNFLTACINDDTRRTREGPYPLHDVASWLAAAGMDPMVKYDRLPSEMPVHDPLADARQSARLLARAMVILEAKKPQPMPDAQHTAPDFTEGNDCRGKA